MTDAELETRLHQLITEARDRNASLAGAYPVRSPEPDAQDYEVLITEIANQLPTTTTGIDS
jgi:hypothetical protein